jgi:hypothetical protein
MPTLTAGNGAAATARQTSGREPQKVLRERIGFTEFIVSVHFSSTSTETIEDKILRFIEREEYEYAG